MLGRKNNAMGAHDRVVSRRTRSANGGGVASFYKATGSQLAIYPKTSWGNADGATGDAITPTTAAPGAAVPTVATTPGCACHSWHKPGCFVGGLAIGVIAGWLFTRKAA